MSEKYSEGLQSIGRSITDTIIELLKSIGGSPADECKIDIVDFIDLEGSNVHQQAQTNAGKPIMLGSQYGVLYIKDNIYNENLYNRDAAVRGHPNDCYVDGKKVHFIWCTTLVEMKESQRKARYRHQKLERDTREIDLSNTRLNVETRLAWCKNCINELPQRFLNEIIQQPRADDIVKHTAEYGNASDISACLELASETLTLIPEGKYKSTQLSTAYPPNWKDISAAFRKERRYVCEECGVACSAYPQVTDAHHINGDKSNCEYSNLQCLCKFCHFKKHSHYNLDKVQMQFLRQLWDAQNISDDKLG